MAHGRSGPDLVMTTRYATSSDIRAMSDHERNRTPDGSSAIDTDRSHLNQILVGPQCQQQAVNDLFASGVRKPTAQAEKPFIQMSLSASPSYFRDVGQGPGEWNQEKLDEWLKATMQWLEKKFGNDVIHVSLHLDEDTPHIHVLIAPTYTKTPRVPGKKKRNETDEEFQERREAAKTAPGVRTVGRASNEFWKKNYAKRTARQSYHRAVEKLGLGYGKDFVAEGQPSPTRKTTGQWVREQAAELKETRNELSNTQRQLQAWDVELDGKERDLYDRELDLPILEFDIQKLKEELQKTEQRQAEAEKKAQDAEKSRAAAEEKAQEADVKRLKAEDYILEIRDTVELLRPAYEAAQVLSKVTELDPETRAELFASMTPRDGLEEDAFEQWTTGIRMCDPDWALNVAPEVPRTVKPGENFDTLSDHSLTSDEDYNALIAAMQKEPGGQEAMNSLQRGEITLSDLNEPGETPAKGWLGRAFDGLKRGFLKFDSKMAK